MALAYHYETALAVNDSEGTDGGNTVGGAVVTAFTPSGDVAMLYDDESGTNGSTAKQTKTSGTEVGTVEFWIEEGTYDIYMNGVYKRRVTVGNKRLTTEQLINSASNYQTGDTVTTTGFSTAGDGGGAQWVASSTTGLTPSQTPANRGAAELVDGSGRLWELASLCGTARREIGVSSLGAFSDDSVDYSLEIQAAINSASFGSGENSGGEVLLGQGEYIAKSLKWKSRVTIVGAGINSTILKLADNANTYLIADETYVDDISFAGVGISARYLTFDGNRDNQTIGTSTVIIKSYRGMFDTCGFNNSSMHACLYTAKTIGGIENTNGLAENTWFKCAFNKNNGAGIYCLDDGVVEIADATISECIFNKNCETEKLADIYADRSAGFKIINNQLYGGGFHNIYLSNFSRGVVSGNHCDLDATLAVSGDEPSCIFVRSFSLGGCAIVSNNPLFLNHDGSSTGAEPKAITIGATSESADFSGNSISQIGSGGAVYKINGTIDGVRIVNTWDSSVEMGDNPYDYGSLDAGEIYGEFTPSIGFDVDGDIDISYSDQIGEYCVRGKFVDVNIKIDFSTNDYTSSSGALRIEGLPFIASSLAGASQTLTAGVCQNIGLSGTGDTFSIAAYVQNNRDFASLALNLKSDVQQTVGVGNIPPSSSFRISISGRYRMA